MARPLNSRKLTKRQVQALIESEGRFHREFTAFFEETYSTGYKNQPQVYELPNDRFLYIFDPKGTTCPGKGNIFSKESFLRWMRWVKRVRDNYANGRGSSVEHWLYYSKNKIQLVDKIDELVNELAICLKIPQNQLDFSYKSLDVLSGRAEEYGLEKVQAELYDNLVAYVGEVIRLEPMNLRKEAANEVRRFSLRYR
jgi:hypothetical protein